MTDPQRLAHHDWLLAVALAVVLTVCLLPEVTAGHLTLIANGDSGDQSLPWLLKVFAATHARSLALWDFSTHSGSSFIGELQTAPLYPPALLFGLFAEPESLTAVDRFLLLHFVIATVGFQVLARTLGVSATGALVGAVIFSFGSAYTLRVGGQPNLFASLSWMPWVQWALLRTVWASHVRTWLRFAGLSAAFMALSFLAGHVHALIMSVAGAVPLCLVVPASRASTRTRSIVFAFVRTALAVGPAGILAAGLAAPQLIASQEYLRLSYKWYGPSYTEYPHVVPYERFAAASLHVPDLATLLNGKEVNALDGGTLYVTRVGLGLALGALLFAAWGSRLRRTTAGAALAAGLGLAFAFSPAVGLGRVFNALPGFDLVRVPARGLFAYAAGAALLGAIGVDQLQARIRQLFPRARVVRASIACLLIAVCLAEIRGWVHEMERPRSGAQVQVAAILHGPVVSFLRQVSAEGPLVFRFYAPRDLVPPNIGNVFPVLSAHGYRSTRTIAYHRDFNFDPLSPRMDAYGVRWWVSTSPVPGLPLVARFGDTVVQERPTALPVFWLAQGNTGVAPPIRDVAWSQNEVLVRFADAVSGRLVFAQSVFPGWKVRLGSRWEPVITHNGMMAVDLPTAMSDITFAYRPDWFVGAFSMSFMTFLAVAAMIVGRNPFGLIHADRRNTLTARSATT